MDLKRFIAINITDAPSIFYGQNKCILTGIIYDGKKNVSENYGDYPIKKSVWGHTVGVFNITDAKEVLKQSGFILPS